MTACVYRAYDESGAILYVGSSKDLEKRLGQHRRSSQWWPLAARIERDEFATIAEARAAEDEAIAVLDPPHNDRGGHAHGSWKNDCPAARCRRVQAGVTDYITRLVDEAPPLTPERRDRLAALLRPAVVPAGAAERSA